MTADSKPRHWRQHIRRQNPEFLYAEDLGPPGTKLDVEIVDCQPGYVKNPGTKKEVYVLTFRGKGKKLGIGASGCKAMTKLSGTSDWAMWRGWITLVVIHTEYFDNTTQQNEETDAIRIAPQRPRGKASAPSKAGDTKAAPAELSDDERAEIERIEREEQA